MNDYVLPGLRKKKPTSAKVLNFAVSSLLSSRCCMAHPTSSAPPSPALPSLAQSASNFDYPCNDYTIFKDQLLKNRKLDDNITYMLNKTENPRPESNFVHDKVLRWNDAL